MKMTIAEILAQVKPYSADERSFADEVEMDYLCRELGVRNPEYYLSNAETELWNQRMHQRYIQTWICTDTQVGTAVIFLDDKPIALSYQSARRYDISYYFFDEEGVNQLRNLLVSFSRPMVRTTELESFVEFDDSIPVVFNQRPNPYTY